jgi:hypothetical protein
MADAGYLSKHYPKGKADLYAAFLQRGLELAKDGGFSALLTMRNWMFISQYSAIREFLIENYDLRLLVDLESGAFQEVSAAQVILSVVMSIFRKMNPSDETSTAFRPTPNDLKSEGNIARKLAALLSQVNEYEFKTQNFNVIEEKPLIYWWDDLLIDKYRLNNKLKEVGEIKEGLSTADNNRYLRFVWEISLNDLNIQSHLDQFFQNYTWCPYLKGANGKVWIEPLEYAVLWAFHGLSIKVNKRSAVRNESFHFKRGIAFSTTGNDFLARVHRYVGIYDAKGRSVFIDDLPSAVCSMNSATSRQIITALNPTIDFSVGDVKRLPLFPIESADEIFRELEKAFSEHEAGRETSVEFISPRPSPWRTAQTWAQTAVDRPAGTPLPPYHPEYDPPTAQDFISYAVGLALGRFGRPSSPQPPSPRTGEGGAREFAPLSLNGRGAGGEGLPILYLSAYSQDLPEIGDSLTHPAAAPIHHAWAEHGSQITKKTLREWLRQDYFKEDHLKRYDQRPIYFPISSTKKNFVAIIPIHQWTDNTLQTLLADHLLPDQTHLIGEINDLMAARNQPDTKASAAAEKRYSELCKFQEELQDLISKVQAIAERGAPPTKSSDPNREVDATFKMDLDDGVMINSAALWTLLEPQWTKPKTWWSELSTAQNKKDYDWSHLAARYFPQRVDEKCQKDPSLAVAHSVFWKYHPAKAYEWELRLQDEISPDFHIEEPDSQSLRDAFIRANPELVLDIRQKEQKRRERKKNKEEDQMAFELVDNAEQEENL